MKWICLEKNNIILTVCGIFYSVLCIFSIFTGLMYAFKKRQLNPVELSNEFVSKLSKENKLEEFAVKMGWITVVVGIFQGISAFGIFYGYNVYLNYFTIFFTVFSIFSVVLKLIKKRNLFSFIKLIAYLLILLILTISGFKKYSATQEVVKYISSDEIVKVKKIDEGYFFDGPGEKSAIIFYPGAAVEAMSYSKLMYKLAYNGFDSFLISMPLDFAFLGIYKPSKIIDKYEYEKWYLQGHSLGGVAACLYASYEPEKVSGVISLASYPIKKLPSNIKYISLYGSEDKVLNKKNLKDSEKFLPPNSYSFIIQGANHAGFGNYGFQNKDGNALITPDEQQDYVVNKIIEILQ